MAPVDVQRSREMTREAETLANGEPAQNLIRSRTLQYLLSSEQDRAGIELF